MKQLSWLFLSLVACCCVCQAQQRAEVPDSTTDPPIASHVDGGRSLFVNFTATVKESNKVWLQWDIDSAEEGDYFIVERSPDGSHYETIGAIRQTGSTTHYELTDGAPPNGSDFYRIKYSAPTATPAYSKTMQLSLSGEVDFKFYPNPVDKLFIVRTEHSIDLQVMDASGAVRLNKRLQPGIQVVNVSSLERGVYVLRVTDKESNRAISHQLLKN
jgi:Secretion system C-terminal sorting domain